MNHVKIHFTFVKRKGYGDECHLTVVLCIEKRNKKLRVQLRSSADFVLCYMHFTESTNSNVRLYCMWQHVHSLFGQDARNEQCRHNGGSWLNQEDGKTLRG
jgi:hypothetical protein